MNVIIANKYKEMLMSLNIEVMKSMEGVFSVDEIINTFENFYFDKMILDVTAIKDYEKFENLQKLSVHLDANKIILILDNTPDSESRAYLSKLISMGIYNFTRNIAGINYLLVHPNSYRDVVHIHNLKDVQEQEEIENRSQYVEHEPQNIVEDSGVKIIGVKSVTSHSGATTLTYLMKKHLERNYKVVAMEVNKNDFLYYPDRELITTNSSDLPKELMKHQDYEVVLIDLNNYEDEGICTDILYLLEPSLLKLNKLVKMSKTIFDNYKNKKVILTHSMLDTNEVAEFEYESKLTVFFNLPPLDDRKESIEEINKLLQRLGFNRQEDSESNKNSKSDIFKI